MARMAGILGPIGLTFVFWGGSNSLDFSGVSKQHRRRSRRRSKIPASEATQAWSDTQARWSRQFGTDIPDEQRVRDPEEHPRRPGAAQAAREAPRRRALPRERCRACSANSRSIPQFQGPDGKFDADHRAIGARADQQDPNSEFFAETRIAAAGQPAAAGHRRFVLPDARGSSSACSISRTKNAKSQYAAARGRAVRGQASRSTRPPSRPTTTRTAIAS